MMAAPNFQVNLTTDPNTGQMSMGPMSMGQVNLQQQSAGYSVQGQGMQPGGGFPDGKAPVRMAFDPRYLKTLPGKLKIAELLNNASGIGCIMMSQCPDCSNSNWFDFVATTGFIVTCLLIICYFFHIVERFKVVPWLGIELLYCATWTLFYMIAALVVAVKASRDDAWAAASFFGFLGTLLYAADCYTKYNSWNQGIPAQGDKPASPNYDAY